MKKKNKNNSVHIICILDRSGSMASLQNEVINSFNNFLETQKSEKGKAYLSLVLFDDQYEVIYDKVNIKKVCPIDNTIYYARGMTSLYDAIGKTISSICDKNVMVLIQTDGNENSSQEYSQNAIKNIITSKEQLGWDFTFLGANIDTVKEGSKMGLSASKSISFAPTSRGVEMAYNTMSNSTSMYRSLKEDEKDV